jgi:predicted GNAT family acetyltransferase
MSDVQTTDNPEQQRYEARVDGDLAGFAAYQLDGDRVVFTHTEVDDAYEGQGVGSALARSALDDVRASGRSAVPRCRFIRGWIDKHPDYADLVAA